MERKRGGSLQILLGEDTAHGVLEGAVVDPALVAGVSILAHEGGEVVIRKVEPIRLKNKPVI